MSLVKITVDEVVNKYFDNQKAISGISKSTLMNSVLKSYVLEKNGQKNLEEYSQLLREIKG